MDYCPHCTIELADENTEIRTLSTIENDILILGQRFRKILSDPSVTIEKKLQISMVMKSIYGSSDSIQVKQGRLQTLWNQFRQWKTHTSK